MKVRLYVISGSHPGVAARLMLERKGIEYRRIDLPAGLSRRLIKLLGFSGDRTPAMKVDGRKTQGSTQISRELERLRPDPPLFPADPQKRKRVEEAESWGDTEFQPIPRTIVWWALRRDRSAVESFLGDASRAARLGLPPSLAAKTAGPFVRLGAKLNQSNDEHVRAQLARLPGALDQVDRWIEEGVLNGQELNAADFQIGPTLRLLMAFDDLRPVIESRPAGALAERLLPKLPGRIPPVFPGDWLAPLQARAAA